jgi:hypothetical protein
MALNATDVLNDKAALYDFYDRELRYVLLEQERIRKTSQRNFFIAAGISVGLSLWAMVSVLPMANAEERWWMLLWGVVLNGVIVRFSYKYSSSYFRKTFKDNIVSRLVTFLDEGLRFSAGGCVPRISFEDSRLFRNINNYRGEDLIHGEVSGLEFAFSEVHAQREKRDSKGRKSKHTIFRGMFFAIELPKRVSATTMIYPRLASQPRFSREVERIKLEDPIFERTFNVYANDQVGARVLLTTQFMEQVMALRQLCKQTPYLSFSHRHLYIAVPSRENLLEASLFQSVLNPVTVRRFISELDTVLSMAKELRLQNSRR